MRHWTRFYGCPFIVVYVSIRCPASCCKPILKYHLNDTPHDSHYSDVIMSAMASQITSLTIVFSTVCLGADQRKHQSSASLAFVWEGPITRKMFPFDDIIMEFQGLTLLRNEHPWPKYESWQIYRNSVRICIKSTLKRDILNTCLTHFEQHIFSKSVAQKVFNTVIWALYLAWDIFVVAPCRRRQCMGICHPCLKYDNV